MSPTSSDSEADLNWTAIAALYVGLVVGIAGLVYVQQYRNAAWLTILGLAGGCTAYGRVLEQRGFKAVAKRWKWASGLLYGGFFLWAGAVLIRALFG